jgi:hypothetical protein
MKRPSLRLLLALVSCVSTLSFSVSSFAYCRMHSCDPRKETCPKDPNNTDCTGGGVPLFWPVRCIGFSLNKDGASNQGISYETFQTVVDNSFAAWQSASCKDGNTPSIQFSNLGAVSCDQIQFNQKQGNANLIVFRTKTWPYQESQNALAITTLSFNPRTGEIFDADMEINASKANTITTSNSNVKNDLQSIITHEAGHFLGIAHSTVEGATMRSNYNAGDVNIRKLSQDDVNAVCSIYPPNRVGLPVCEASPAHGYASECAIQTTDAGCSLAPQHMSHSGHHPWSATGLLTAVGLSLYGLRRRQRFVGSGKHPPLV